jgi:hypothetical protein
MPKLRITVEVDIFDERDIPEIAQMTPHLVQATTATVKELLGDAGGECQGQGMIVGDGLDHLPNPEMPTFLRVRRVQIERINKIKPVYRY